MTQLWGFRPQHVCYIRRVKKKKDIFEWHTESRPSGSNWCWQQTESEVSNHNTGASPSFFPCAYQKSNPRHINKPKRKKKKRDDGYRTEHHIHGELRNPLCLAGYPKSLPNLLLQRLKLYCLFLLFLLSIS